MICLTTDCCCGMFNFNYHKLDVGRLQTLISWNYVSESSEAAHFFLQGFYLNNITSNQLTSPLIIISSSSPTFYFPTQELSSENIYWKVFANGEEGKSSVSFSNYYNFGNLLANGMNCFE